MLKRANLATFLITSLAVLLQAGCGGGGGNNVRPDQDDEILERATPSMNELGVIVSETEKQPNPLFYRRFERIYW